MPGNLPVLFEIEPEEALAYLFDRLPVGTAVIDRDFRLRRCNPTWTEFIERYTPSSAEDVVPGVSLFELEPGTEQVLRPLFVPAFAGEKVHQEGIRLESGGIVSYWDLLLVPLESEGRVVAVLDVSLDVTAHVLGQQALQATLDALQESETNLRSMLENASGYAIYRLAVDPGDPYLGKVLLVSPSICDLIGIDDPYDFEQWFSGIHPDDWPRIVASNRRALEEGLPFDETMRFYDRRREVWRWVHTVSNPIFGGDGRVTHFNGLTIDVTERVQAQETLTHLNEMLEWQIAERTQEMTRQHQALQALYTADEELYQHLELDAVLQSLVDVAVDVLEADKSSLMVWDRDSERLLVQAAHGFGMETLAQMSFLPGEGAVGRVALSGEMAVVEDTARDDEVLTRITEPEGIRSFMHCPLIVSGEVFGVFNVDYNMPRSFPAEEQRLFAALARRAAIAIENARLYEEEQKRRQESEQRRRVAEALAGIVRVLNSSRPLPEILSYIASRASQLIGADICTLHHIDYKTGFVHIEASHGLPPSLLDISGFPLLSSSHDQLILDRKPVVINLEQTRVLDPARESMLEPRVRRWRATLVGHYPAFLAVPLVVEDEVYGSLAFYFTKPQTFGQETIELAMSLGEQAALAIDNARLRLRAERVAVTTERNRLARELHDAVTQTLFSASLIADVLPRIWERDPGLGREKLAELRELTRGALAEMRTLLLELRPATLTESSLEELLRQLALAASGRSRIQIEVVATGGRPLSPDAQVALYRIAQEALNNVVKHSGAEHVTISLHFLPEQVELSVADDGRGFDASAVSVHSLGLGIMRERADAIGAELQVDSTVGQGTTVRLVVSA
jgi:PAS domain S-box-containing protein